VIVGTIRLAASVVIEQNDEWLVGRAISQPTRWRPFLIEKEKRTTAMRRRASSPRPEQPTMPTSYTTSLDLTLCRSLATLVRATAKP